MRFNNFFKIILFAILLSAGKYNSSFAQRQDTPHQFELFDKDTAYVLDLATDVKDNFVTIRNNSAKYLYILDQTWKQDSISAIEFKGEGNLNLSNYSATIIPPGDSISVEIDISFEDQQADNWLCGGLLTIYYVFEGEDILRNDSLYLKMQKNIIPLNRFAKYSMHAVSYKEFKTCDLLYKSGEIPSVGIENNYPDKTFYIDTIVINTEPKRNIKIARYLYHNKQFGNDTTGLKLYFKSNLFYFLFLDTKTDSHGVINTEVILRDSSTNQIFAIKDTLYCNVYLTTKQKSQRNSWINDLSDCKDKPCVITFSSFVCADDEIIIENLQLIENKGENFFVLGKTGQLPFKLKNTPALKIIPETVLCEVKFATNQINETKIALVKTTYRSLVDGKLGYYYFPIVVFPN